MTMSRSLTADRAFKIALVCGAALSLAACGTVRNALPFGLGGDDGPTATASEGQRVSVLEFEQQLAPSAALAGRDFFLPGPVAATSWSQPGRNAENNVEHVIAAPSFTVAWRASIGAGSSRPRQVMGPPVADGGRIYTIDADRSVRATDETGRTVWRTDIRPEGREDGGFGGGVAVSGGQVFVASGHRVVTALDAATGAQVWQTRVDVPIHGSPTVAGGRIYVVDIDNLLYAFDARTGQQVWTYRGIPEPARLMRASSPAVLADTVIAPFASGEVVALRANNGQPVWSEVLSRTSRTSALSEIRDIAGRPVISRGTVFAVSHSGVIAAMDQRSGARRWELPIAGVNAPLPVGDVVYVVSKSGELTVVNRESGQVYWTRDLNEGRVREQGGFLGIGARAVRPQWTGPILASNRLVLGNSFGDLVAFDPKTGEQVASLRLGDPIYAPPIAYNGRLYVVTDAGQLVAIS